MFRWGFFCHIGWTNVKLLFQEELHLDEPVAKEPRVEAADDVVVMSDEDSKWYDVTQRPGDDPLKRYAVARIFHDEKVRCFVLGCDAEQN